MMAFNYKIKEQVGVNARPAIALAKKAEQYNSKIEIEGKHSRAEVTRLASVVALGIKKDDVVSVFVSGDDEADAAEAMLSFFQENL